MIYFLPDREAIPVNPFLPLPGPHMKMKAIHRGPARLITGAASVLFTFLLSVTATCAGETYPLLSDLIIEYNLEALETSITQGTYRGEAGILRIVPEAARSLGMKALINDDYQEAMALLRGAKRSLEEAKKDLRTRKAEPEPGHFARRVLHHALEYTKQTDAAALKLSTYRHVLEASGDERLNRAVTAPILEKLIQEGLKETGNGLRDTLGFIYNTCTGNEKGFPYLISNNIRFVNAVFRRYKDRGPSGALDTLDLDRSTSNAGPWRSDTWKRIFEQEGCPFASDVESVMARHAGRGPRVDPLLFLALMRRESGFNPRAISPAGAVGLTQIMPETGRRLGMKSVYEPDYFKEALIMAREERKARRLAMEAFARLKGREDIPHARQARALMQKSLDLREKRRELIRAYKKDLLGGERDDRLIPALAISHGYTYLSRLLALQGGDISLALASYNAGPHRVQQYGGIPPFPETVNFRNQVIASFRDYRQRAKSF